MQCFTETTQPELSSSCVQELSSVRQEVVKARQESHSLDSAVHELERSIQQLTTRVAVQEQELKDKEEVCT